MKTKKLVSQEEMQNRMHKLKDPVDCVSVVHGDVIKFGRVRFRVKKLVTQTALSKKLSSARVGTTSAFVDQPF